MYSCLSSIVKFQDLIYTVHLSLSLSVSLSPSMFIECLHTLLALSVPDSHCLVITAGHNKPTVRTELCTPHPVTVASQSELKPLPIHSPHLHGEKYKFHTYRKSGNFRGKFFFIVNMRYDN